MKWAEVDESDEILAKFLDRFKNCNILVKRGSDRIFYEFS